MIASKIIQRNLSKEDNERAHRRGAETGRRPPALSNPPALRSRSSSRKVPSPITAGTPLSAIGTRPINTIKILNFD